MVVSLGMELLDHLGFRFQGEINVNNLWMKLKAIAIVNFLFLTVIFLNGLSIKFWILLKLFPDSTVNIQRLLQTLFWDFCLYLVSDNLHVSLMGDKLELESAVLVSNHQSLGDHILMAYLARYTNNVEFAFNQNLESSYFLTLPRINFFTWFSIWQIPNYNIWFNMFKSDENWELDSNLTPGLVDDVVKSKFVEWVVVFPEVNIFTIEDLNIQNHNGSKYFLPPFNHVLYPRFSAFANIIQGLAHSESQKFTRLYDITISYQTQPSLIDFFTKDKHVEVHIYVKKRMITKIPVSRFKLEKYLEYTWIEKNKLLSRMRTLPKISNVSEYTSLLEKARSSKTPKSIKTPMKSFKFHQPTCEDVSTEAGAKLATETTKLSTENSPHYSITENQIELPSKILDKNSL